MKGPFLDFDGDLRSLAEALPGLRQVDLPSDRGLSGPGLWTALEAVNRNALASLKQAHSESAAFVLFKHDGLAAGDPAERSVRGVLRRVMRRPESTPYILRTESIMHDEAFVAAIRGPDGKAIMDPRGILSALESKGSSRNDSIK